MMKNLALFLLFFSTAVSAQEISISGTITDIDGNPIEDVAVRLLKANLVDTTDANGDYTLSNFIDGISVISRPQSGIKSIQYTGNQFYVFASLPANASIKLYSLNGKLLSTLYDGSLKSEYMQVPILKGTDNYSAFILVVQCANKTYGQKFISGMPGKFSFDDIQNTEDEYVAKKSVELDWLQASKEGIPTSLEEIVSYSSTVDINNFGKEGYYLTIHGSESTVSYDEVPAPPSPEDGYRHIQYLVPTHDGYYQPYNTWTAINPNGSRVAALFESGRNADSTMLLLFDVASESAIWTNTVAKHPGFQNLDLSNDGRAVIASQDGKVSYYEEDSKEPKWWVEMVPKFHPESDDQKYNSHTLPPKFSWNGNRILTGFCYEFRSDLSNYSDDSHKYSHELFVLNRFNGTPVYSLKFQMNFDYSSFFKYKFWNNAWQMFDYEISRDGETVVVIARGQSPDDPLGIDQTDYLYEDTRIMCFKGGEFLWDYWLMREAPDGVVMPLSYYVAQVHVDITFDGEYVIAAGSGGRVVKLETNTGKAVWSDQMTAIYENGNDDIPCIARVFGLSSSYDGNKISVNYRSLLPYVDYGLTYYDLTISEDPIWHASDADLKHNLDYTLDEDAKPFGYNIDPYETYPNTGMRFSSDEASNVFGFRRGKDIALFFPGSPIPFHKFHLDKSLYSESYLNAFNICGNGTYFTCTSAALGLASDFSLNIVEIPPGVIVDCKRFATLNVYGGEILGAAFEAMGTDEMIVQIHTVKPGRAAILDLDLECKTSLEASLGDFPSLCLPWQTGENRRYTMDAGFKSKTLNLEWDTPDCLLNFLFMGAMPGQMILHSKLYDGDIYVSEAYDNYLNFTIIIPSEKK